MTQPPKQPRDPIGLTLLLVVAFTALAAIRLTIPGKPYFDEIHYVPAARVLLDLSDRINMEHPPLGKEFIALGMALWGDNAFGWRTMPLAFGTLALLAAMRGMWFASLSRFATLAYGVLLATGFHLLVLSRIAMLDIFMAAFVMLAFWMCAAAVRDPGSARRRLAVAGISLGAAMASKWNAIPIAMAPGLAFLVWRARAAGARFVTARQGPPVPGMGLPEAFVWLGVVPVCIYLSTFVPYFFLDQRPVSPDGLIALQFEMLELQTQPLASHTYQSVWYQWVANVRPIWFLYEQVGGLQRGILLIGNPASMLLGLPALAWCLYVGIRQKENSHLAMAAGYCICLGMWIVAAKNVQFYYHYSLPGFFLLGALALALGDLRKAGNGWLVWTALASNCAVFVYFWPILTAAPLEGSGAFQRWAWLASWI